MLKFPTTKQPYKEPKVEKIAHVSGKARYINSPIGLDHQLVHSKDHRAPIHPKGAFRKTMIHDLRKDNNIKGKYIQTLELTTL